MCEWGIRNYQPQWANSKMELLELIRKIPLTGIQVTSLWSLWDEDSDEWFNDAPIVICTQKKQLEFCATKLNEFSFSFDSIDLSSPVYWCGEKSPDARPLRWVQQKNPELKNLSEALILEIEIVESALEEDIQIFLGLEPWILLGIALKFQGTYLEILNGLDCNLLSRTRKTDKKLRYTRVIAAN